MLDSNNIEDRSSPVPPMVLIMGTADWNQAIATNQHYMARELSAQYPVKFSESLGLRRPELTRRDVSRMLRRVHNRSQAASNLRAVPNNLEVIKPIVLPLHRGAAKRVNLALLHRYYKAWSSHRGPRILWTYSPLTYGFEKRADLTIYHCVDLLGEFPQIDRTLVRRGEDALANHTQLAIGSSAAVYEHLLSVGFPRVEHWPNVADVSVIREAEYRSPRREVARAVFAGNFSEKKVDFTLLAQLIDAGVELHLAGPVAEGGGNAAGLLNDLVRAGAVYHGHLALPDLAKLYWTSTIGLIPYRLNSYTNGVNPLKTYEYLAAGLRVISTAVPAVVPHNNHVNVSQEAADFVRDAINGLREPTPEEVSQRQSMADENSWTLRGQLARGELQSMLRTPGGSP